MYKGFGFSTSSPRVDKMPEFVLGHRMGGGVSEEWSSNQQGLIILALCTQNRGSWGDRERKQSREALVS
jgi:hypothetical protein